MIPTRETDGIRDLWVIFCSQFTPLVCWEQAWKWGFIDPDGEWLIDGTAFFWMIVIMEFFHFMVRLSFWNIWRPFWDRSVASLFLASGLRWKWLLGIVILYTMSSFLSKFVWVAINITTPSGRAPELRRGVTTAVVQNWSVWTPGLIIFLGGFPPEGFPSRFVNG